MALQTLVFAATGQSGARKAVKRRIRGRDSDRDIALVLEVRIINSIRLIGIPYSCMY